MLDVSCNLCSYYMKVSPSLREWAILQVERHAKRTHLHEEVPKKIPECEKPTTPSLSC